ncbi:MAG: hypothetical protein U0872_06220 [Planctomycetaceae bacterium]
MFYIFKIDLEFRDLKISVEDLVSAVAGSLLCILGWWIGRKFWKKSPGSTN